MSDALGALFRADSWNFPGLKDGQILRTISNVTCSESHYASDEDKSLFEASRRHRLAESSVSEVTGISGVSQQLLHSLPSVPTACTVVLAGSSGHAGEHKERFSPVEAAPDSEAQKERSQPGVPTFDITANAGIPAHGREALQHFLPPERAGLFADMLGHLDFGAGGSTASPKLMAVQLQNLSHLFDDLDKAGSDVSECPDTPLHLFPNTPTSELLLQGHFAGAHFAPEAQTPPQGTPSLQRSSRHGQGSQALSQALGSFASGVVEQSPMSPPPMSCSRTRSTPTPGGQGSYSSAHRPTDHIGERALSSPLPPLLEAYSFPPPIRTRVPDSPAPRPSPARPAGVRKVQASVQAQLRVRVAGRRSVSLNSGPGAELAGRPEPSPRPAEDASASGPGTEDSEGDSARTEGGSKKRKAPGKKGAGRRARRMTCRNCAAHQTPQWRCGPEGPRTLCNACGVRYKKGLPLNNWPGRAASAAAGGMSGSSSAPALQAAGRADRN